MVQEVGKRKRGRPRRRWIDCVKKDIEVTGIKEEDAAGTRNTWRTAIRTRARGRKERERGERVAVVLCWIEVIVRLCR